MGGSSLRASWAGRRRFVVATFAVFSVADRASAEPTASPNAPPPPSAGSAPSSAPERVVEEGARPSEAERRSSALEIIPTGYVEAYYAHNFNRPSNGITNYRGFDNRHGTFSLSNAALGANWTAGPVGGRLVLQIGSTPSTYYGSEPGLAGAGGANATSAELWKYLQEAFVMYRAPVGRGLTLQLGLCASPIGFEVFAVKDNWNWSRSNLFFGFPYYHTGLRATYAWTDELSSTVSIFNGWNSVVDANEEKSVQTNFTYRVENKVLVQALYFGGIERPSGSPEGPYWRHHFDGVGQLDVTKWLSLATQADYGWEPTRFGTARWLAGAFYARVEPMRRVFVAVRGDRFHENVATDDVRTSSPVFWSGARWVSSGTATLDLRPHDGVSVRLELRHDVAERALYFRDAVERDGGDSAPFVPNARRQTTVLLGATGWF